MKKKLSEIWKNVGIHAVADEDLLLTISTLSQQVTEGANNNIIEDNTLNFEYQVKNAKKKKLSNKKFGKK